MPDWRDLADEFDAWHAAGRDVHFWWRDDDATRVTPELLRLLAIGAQSATPVALAVIPRDAEEGLRLHLADLATVAVLQHGWSHANHAPTDQKQEEFGIHRPLSVMLAELAQGWQKIARFARSLPVMVAPWNRFDRHLLPHLPTAGLRAVSASGPRHAATACGIREANVHIDPIDWGGTRGFHGLDHVLGQVLRHLRQKRSGAVDASEPTGLMTHHSFHDEGCWAFLAEFLQRTRAHPAVRWLPATDVFP